MNFLRQTFGCWRANRKFINVLKGRRDIHRRSRTRLKRRNAIVEVGIPAAFTLPIPTALQLIY